MGHSALHFSREVEACAGVMVRAASASRREVVNRFMMGVNGLHLDKNREEKFRKILTKLATELAAQSVTLEGRSPSPINTRGKR